MKEDNNHIDFERDFFKSSTVQYSRSKEEVWADMESKLSRNPKGKVMQVNFKKLIWYSAAAVIIMSLGLISFIRLYSVNVFVPNGQHTKIDLPDGSIVTLNANSSLSYYPYWWRFSRQLDFSGEAFFEVKKGKKFVVKSELASTSVLGTSFNIYARKDEYKVNCITGRVMVETRNNESAIIIKNEYTIVNQENKIVKLQDENITKSSIAWIQNEFVFTSMPLKNIYEEIERQFDIEIIGKENLNGISSFNSKRGSSAEEMINLIGRPFGLKCIKISERKYIVEQK
jgi:ferric-dicitrate binding protein FerR (iron transport regulator)